VRYARLRSTSGNWWASRLKSATSVRDHMLLSLVFLTWGAPQTIMNLLEPLEESLGSLTEADWRRLFHSVRFAASWLRSGGWNLDDKDIPTRLTVRLACLVLDRMKQPRAGQFYKRHLSGITDDHIVLEFAQGEALDVENIGKPHWNPNLELVRKFYEIGQTFEPKAARRYRKWESGEDIPLQLALQVTSNAAAYPGFLVSMAEDRCRQDIAHKIVPVADLAKGENWFGIVNL
jgi:hypothetical protein